MICVFDSIFYGSQGGLWGSRADFVIDVKRLQRRGSRQSDANLGP